MNSPKKFKYSYEIRLDEDSTASKLLRLVGQGKKVLELGCGPGHMSRVLKEELQCNVVGVEIDETAAQEAKKYCNKVEICDLDHEDLTRLFPQEQFDIILMADVLEHLKHPDKTLKQAKQLLTSDASLVISVPNVAHQGILACLMNGQFPYSDLGLLDKTHLRFFTGFSFRQLLSRCGLCIDKWLTQEVPVEFTEFSQFFQSLPKAIRDYLDRCPDSTVYQFIVRAKPVLLHTQEKSIHEEGISTKLDLALKERLKERDIWFEKHYPMHGNQTNKTPEKEKHSLLGRLLSLFKK